VSARRSGRWRRESPPRNRLSTSAARSAARTAWPAAVEAGYVWINGSSRHYVGTPFGGLKSSGIGREECVEELLSFTETKAVRLAYL
jgi:acyl-CoA reductase-like NAD-dependent aldehyde dehydrogenase